MSHRTCTLITALTLTALLSACGGDADEPEVLAQETSSASSAPEDEAPEETESPADTGGETAEETGADETTEEPPADETGGDDETGGGEAGELPTVPVEYADALVVAWGAGDHATMEQFGTAEVVHILGDGGGPNWVQVDSAEYAGSTEVTYENTDSGDHLMLRVDHGILTEGGEQAVIQAEYTVAGDEVDLPTEPAAYADALVVAWGAGEQAVVERMATPEVVHILGDGGGPTWQQTGAEGAAGSTIVTYENTDSGDVLSLRVDNAAASEGADRAVVEARYETP